MQNDKYGPRQVNALFGHDDLVAFWVKKGFDSTWTPGHGSAIGYTSKEGKLVAGVCFYDHWGPTVFMDVRCEDQANWFHPQTMFEIFHYVFEQLNCKDLRCNIARSNVESVRLAEKQGMELEAVLKDAHPSGDLLIYKLSKEKVIKWLKPQEEDNK